MKFIFQLPKHYIDLIEKRRKTVLAYVAVTKKINGRRYLDALSGFLVDKKNATVPLENPCVIKIKLVRKHNNDKSPSQYE